MVVVLFQPSNFTLAAFRPADFFLVLIFIGQMIYRPKLSKNISFSGYFGLLNLAILLVGYFSIVLFSTIELNASSIFMAYFYARFFIIYHVVFNITRFDGPIDGFKFFSISILIVFLVSAAQFLSIEPISRISLDLYQENKDLEIYDLFNDAIRVVGVVGNANGLGVLLSSFVCLLIAKQLVYPSRLPFSIALVFVLSILVVVMTGSRTAIISVILFSILTLTKFASLKKWALMLGFSLLFLWGFSFFFVEVDIVPSRVKSLFSLDDTGSKLDEFAPRLLLWYQKFQAFDEIQYSLKYWIGVSYTQQNLSYSDNGFINAFFNLGVLGLIVRLILFSKVISLPRLVLNLIRVNPQQVQLKTSFMSASICFPLIFFEITGDAIEYYRLSQILFVFLALSTIGLTSKTIDETDFNCDKGAIG